jgi:hypothetical protein
VERQRRRAMLMPALSVTAIAVVVGLVVGGVRGQLLSTLVWSVGGAWVGFLAGALVGVAIDVAVRAGQGVLIIGHLAAAAGAVLAVTRSRPSPA